MNTQLIIDYFSSLSMNNNCEQYHANKDDFKKANAEFEKLLQTLISENLTIAFWVKTGILFP